MKLKDLVKIIDEIAPVDMAEPWDNCGFQIGKTKEDAEISKVLVALEVTGKVIEEAKALGADMILTHHPMYFKFPDIVNDNNITGNYIVSLINADIAVYSAHTNFDKVSGGNNDYLAKLLGLSNIRPLVDAAGLPQIGVLGDFLQNEKNIPSEESLGIKPAQLTGSFGIEFNKLLQKISEVLKLPAGGLRVSTIPGQNYEHVDSLKPETQSRFITTLGICTGSGADLAELAFAQFIKESSQSSDSNSSGSSIKWPKNYDNFAFLTGDLKYHGARDFAEKGITVIDAGHFGTEWIFVPNMASLLKAAVGDEAEIYKSSSDGDSFTYISNIPTVGT